MSRYTIEPKHRFYFTDETRGHRLRVSGKEPTRMYTIRVGRLLFKALRLIGPDYIRQWLTDYAIWRLKLKGGLQELDQPIVLQISGTEEK